MTLLDPNYLNEAEKIHCIVKIKHSNEFSDFIDREKISLTLSILNKLPQKSTEKCAILEGELSILDALYLLSVVRPPTTQVIKYKNNNLKVLINIDFTIKA